MRPIDFDSWFQDVNVTGAETAHCYGDHHELAKIWPGFQQTSHIDVSLFSGCGDVLDVFSMILWTHNYFLSQHMRYQYEFIVVNGQTMVSIFHKVVYQQY